jgi:external thioesterase TEII
VNKVKLILLHFAGGNFFSFRFMYPHLKDYEIISLELPGRGKRYNEPLIAEFNSALDYLYKQLMYTLSGEPLNQFIIYGHSMGSLLGFYLASRLEREGQKPLSLIVTGNCGPGIRDEKDLSLLDDNGFLNEVIKLGGISDELLKQDELLQFFVPILRADFAIVEKCESAESSLVINTPIYAVMGDQEEYVAHITNWENYTKAQFKYEILPGNHFFIHQHAQKIAELIRKAHVTNTLLPT